MGAYKQRRVRTLLQQHTDYISPPNEKGEALPPVFYCWETGMRFESDTGLDHSRGE